MAVAAPALVAGLAASAPRPMSGKKLPVNAGPAVHEAVMSPGA